MTGEVGIQVKWSMTLFLNCTSAIKLAKNTVYHEKTKHVEVDWHFIRDEVEKRMWCKEKGCGAIQMIKLQAFLLKQLVGIN